tara:strand:- start:113 stop:478 length:366 start_codon:yes stop_codon:yes gene_type:complete
MKVKLSQIVNSIDALNRISKQPMKAIVSFKMAKNLKLLSEEISTFEQSKNDLIVKYGKENKEGQIGIEPNTKEMTEFQKELGELAALEVNLEGFNKIKLSNLSKCELSPEEMISLEFAIEE